jgi:hypothetical protein
MVMSRKVAMFASIVAPVLALTKLREAMRTLSSWFNLEVLCSKHFNFALFSPCSNA